MKMTKTVKNYEVVEQTGPVPLTKANLIMEAERGYTEVKWMAKRLAKKGFTYSIVKDREGTIVDDSNMTTKSAVIYRLYSNAEDFFTPDR